MKAGDIVFVRGNSLISKLILLFDKGKFSHVCIAVSDTHVLEAQGWTKSRIVPMQYKDYEIVDLGLTEEERQLVMETAPLLVGKWYDYLQILSYILKGNFNNVNNLICSELVVIVLLQLGKLEMDDHYFELINYTPNQLYSYLKERL